jgi:hypothetical protein
VVDKEPIYTTRWTFTCPNKLCTFDAPYAWAYSHTESNDKTTIVDKFASPDGRSYIEHLVYDDGTAVSKSDSGRFALTLLHKYYADDLKVTDDTPQTDGSERLIWNSASGGYEGVTFFETRGTPFLMWTWVVNSDVFDVYNDLSIAILKSYKVP